MSFSAFETAIGTCGIAWGDRGITALWLPGRLPQRASAAPPPAIARAIEDIVALLAGEARDLASIELDMSEIAEFPRRVYELARRIPPGSTVTYGDLAHRLGMPGAARAVGKALGQNPFPPVVPCHRVLAAGGKIGGFSADGGVATKRQMLAIESAALPLFARK